MIYLNILFSIIFNLT